MKQTTDLNSTPRGINDKLELYSLGICAMDKKVQSKPMQEILSRIQHEFQIIIFGDDTILYKPVELWPICNALIAFSSGGFPLEKAKRYVELRNPVLVNDLKRQEMLVDRRKVYKQLQAYGIPVPRHLLVDRDNLQEEPDIKEEEDFIEVNGERLYKPFVEKPVDGDDHNIYIYYPMSAGGGCKRLFRKVGNRSSEFIPHENCIRREGSYIYEEFLSTQGTDVKVYTVGPSYAHAEARKSPVLDGKVMRDANGKEIRYPVILSTEEKEMARKVCIAFEQTVCGFDILRVSGASYVCDVNGWSFVKNSNKYYQDCSTILVKYLHKSLMPVFERRPTRSLSIDWNEDKDEADVIGSTSDNKEEGPHDIQEELRCVIAVIRHGDRTPKQKMKMNVCHPYFLEYFAARTSSSRKNLKIKAVADLEKLLSVSKSLISLYENEDTDFMRFLLDRGDDHIHCLRTLRDVLQRWALCGINRKVQLKPLEWTASDNGVESASKLLLILKWGGVLTHSGMIQAENLGSSFRHSLYPGSQDGGLLRLHSTYRHDLKIYASDEGRVQKTAAAFAKGFLELEGDIIPILVSLVLKSKDANSMLDQSGTTAQETIIKVKQRLHDILHRGDDCGALKHEGKSNIIRTVAAAIDGAKQSVTKMEIMHKLLGNLKNQIDQLEKEDKKKPCGRETLSMMHDRWKKLYADFYSPKKNTFDLSKIPDIHDCIRYDAMHNAHLNLNGVRELLDISKGLADILVPQEYGIDSDEKLLIGTNMCHNLLKKIRDDFDIARGLIEYRLDPKFARDRYIKSAHRSVRTRLYFTSESHLHTLINVLRFPAGKVSIPLSEDAIKWLKQVPELSYMTHVVFRLFERINLPEDDPFRFRTEIMFSPGATGDPITEFTPNSPIIVEPLKTISREFLTCQELEEYISQAITFSDMKPLEIPI